mmetsp:Transcript_19561/g.62729  ORF Transcript_19561/g.62729 Transcript_19561/m.62729 type:complete len:466 (+) Transcript_19561:846-2243(+)
MCDKFTWRVPPGHVGACSDTPQTSQKAPQSFLLPAPVRRKECASKARPRGRAPTRLQYLEAQIGSAHSPTRSWRSWSARRARRWAFKSRSISRICACSRSRCSWRCLYSSERARRRAFLAASSLTASARACSWRSASASTFCRCSSLAFLRLEALRVCCTLASRRLSASVRSTSTASLLAARRSRAACARTMVCAFSASLARSSARCSSRRCSARSVERWISCSSLSCCSFFLRACSAAQARAFSTPWRCLRARARRSFAASRTIFSRRSSDLTSRARSADLQDPKACGSQRESNSGDLRCARSCARVASRRISRCSRTAPGSAEPERRSMRRTSASGTTSAATSPSSCMAFCTALSLRRSRRASVESAAASAWNASAGPARSGPRGRRLPGSAVLTSRSMLPGGLLGARGSRLVRTSSPSSPLAVGPASSNSPSSYASASASESSKSSLLYASASPSSSSLSLL